MTLKNDSSFSFLIGISLLFLLFFPGFLAAQCDNLTEDFSGGWPSTWSRTSSSEVEVNNGCNGSNGNALQINGSSGAWAETPSLDVSGASKVDISYIYRQGDDSNCDNNPESGDNIDVEYWDGGAWVQLANYDGCCAPNTFTNENFTVTTGLTNDFRLRFRMVNGNGSAYDNFNFDDVQIIPTCCSAPKTLETPYNTDNQQDGIMFDITNTASKEVIVGCFETDLSSGTHDVEIYYKSGTHVGFEGNSGAWNLAGSSTVTGNGVGNPDPIPTDVGVTIPCGETYGFYITTTDASGLVHYTDGTAVGDVINSDGNIEILEGTGKNYAFGTDYKPRRFNGRVHYDLGSTCVSGCDSLREDFAGGWPSGWSRSSSSEVEVNNSCNGSNGNALQVNGASGAWAETPSLDVSSATQVNISYIYRQGDNSDCDNNPESGDNIDVEYWDGGAWVQLANYDGCCAPNTFTNENFTVTTGLTNDFRLRFRMVNGNGSAYDNFNFDDVEIATSCPSGGSCVHITECDTEWNSGNDFIEIQNTSSSSFDASGWVVAISDDYTNIDDKNPDEWSLGTINAGQVLYRTDETGDNYWGSNIYWNGSSEGWAMIVDDVGDIRDFVAWGWTSTDIQNLSTTVNGFNVTVGSQWSGGGLTIGDNYQRKGSSDNNDASDWDVGPTSGHTKGVENGSISVPFSNCSALPVELLFFEGECKNGRARFRWSTATESNNRKFLIEKSEEGHDYRKIGEVKGNGTTSQEMRYTWSHATESYGLAYYRLKQVDIDGATETYGPIAVEGCERNEGSLWVLDNGSSHPQIQVRPRRERAKSITLHNPRGKEVHRFDVSSSQGVKTLSLPSDLSPGVYFVRFISGEEKIVKKVLIGE